MKSLPFVQKPAATATRRCGTPASGILEFPVLGGLTVGESAVITQLLTSEQSSFVKGAQMADVIAKSEKISLSEAFAVIEAAISGKQLEPDADLIRIRHAAEIEEVARVYAKAGQANMTASVTALIRCRLGMGEWELADTEQLHRALFNDIWQLAQDEQAAEDQPTASLPDEEVLGKPPAANGSSRKRTGSPSVTT